MYEEIYNLSGNPFKLTPNPEFFYPSRIHKKVMAYLQYGVEQGDGFIVVTGDVGTGKTTIIQTLTDRLKKDRDILIAQLTSTQLNEGELLRMIASSFGLVINKKSKAVLLNDLEKFLREKASENKRVLLIVDEAQNMPKRSLEELRMLSNYQENGRPLFQSFLVGQQQFKKIINRKDMEQLMQRVIASYHLEALDIDDTKNYIIYRLKQVGWKQYPAFDDSVFERIYLQTHGVPRRINVFCDRLMLFAAMAELDKITIHTIDAVISEIGEETVRPGKAAGSAKRLLHSAEGEDSSKVDELEKRLRKMERKLKHLEDTIDTLVDEYELN